MGSLDPSKIEVLRDFARVATEQGLQHIVIGAGARVLACELVDLKLGRMTDDWDLAVPVKDWATYTEFVTRLAEISGAPFQSTRVEHRFRHRSTGIPLDLIPFGGVEQEPLGYGVWHLAAQEPRQGAWHRIPTRPVSGDLAHVRVFGQDEAGLATRKLVFRDIFVAKVPRGSFVLLRPKLDEYRSKLDEYHGPMEITNCAA